MRLWDSKLGRSTGSSSRERERFFGLQISIAAFVLCVIMTITRFGTCFVNSASVLIGIVVGMVVFACFGLVDLSHVAAASWFDVV